MGTKPKFNRNVVLALAVSIVCLILRYALAGEGYHTLNLFGSGYGLANLKAHPFVVLKDQLFAFPYSLVFFYTGIIACAVAVGILIRQCIARRSNG